MEKSSNGSMISLMALAILTAPLGLARQPAATAKPGTEGPTTPAGPAVLPSLDSVLVQRVWVSGTTDARPDTTAMPMGDSATARMGQLLMLQVRFLDSLNRRAQCRSADDRVVSECVQKPILLFLGGRAIAGLSPEAIIVRRGERFGILQFHLQRTEASDEAWADLLGGPRWSELYLRPTDVSTGIEGQSPVSTGVVGRRFLFQRVDPGHFRFWSVVFLLAIAAFIWYAAKSDLLRDVGERPLGQGREKPFSLGRCQMAWWFILVVGGFSFIFLVTGSWHTITGATLGLLGISATTFLGAAAIDSDHITTAENELKALNARRAELQAEAAELARQMATPVTSQEAQAEAHRQLVLNQGEQSTLDRRIPVALLAAEPAASRGFLHDVLGDGRGQSFHRLQMAIWSIVLGVLFVNQVWHRLAMPEFDATLLGLLGISNGTYLGFKFPERQT